MSCQLLIHWQMIRFFLELHLSALLCILSSKARHTYTVDTFQLANFIFNTQFFAHTLDHSFSPTLPGCCCFFAFIVTIFANRFVFIVMFICLNNNFFVFVFVLLNSIYVYRGMCVWFSITMLWNLLFECNDTVTKCSVYFSNFFFVVHKYGHAMPYRCVWMSV